jgi:tetratricopeptide (TPR) repeat protein
MLRTFHLLFFAIATAIAVQSLAFSSRASQSASGPTALDLIYRQKYDDAITRLEEILESDPHNAEALTYMATANLYQTLNIDQAQKQFEEAFKAGGGATFFVTHSHEMFTTGADVDYCRGWLHLRRDTVEFVPLQGPHGFKLKYSEIEELKRNKISKKAFHIKAGKETFNFRGRTNSDDEALLIVALYNSFTRN